MFHLSWFRSKRPLESQFDSELSFHIDRLTEEKVRAGVSPEEARREAVLEFGGREQVKEELRDVQRILILESTAANLKSSFRLIRKSPSFSATVIVTLALGIGANTAVFSAINAILLRPLPFPNGDELVMLRHTERKTNNPAVFIAPVRLEDWNRLNSTFQAISGWYTSDVSEASDALPERVTEALVAPRFLQVWGFSPSLGRDFTAEEEHFGGPNAVLISNRYWRHRFNADPNAIGKSLRLEQHLSTIVGIMPALFLFPDHDVDIWAPSPADAPIRSGTGNQLGIWRSAASSRASRLLKHEPIWRMFRRTWGDFPATDASLATEIQPLKETTVGGSRRSLWILFGSVSLLLLIACTNIAALLLARTTEREREISVRFSLGASRLSVIGQLMTECFVLALTGSALGLSVAFASTKLLRTLAKSLPRAEEITLDRHILLYTFFCAVAATLLCGLLPAILGTRQSLSSHLAHSSRSQVSARNPAQWLLVGIQVALAVTLLIGASLLFRSFQPLGRVSPGFDSTHVLTFRISGNWGETGDMKQLTARINHTLEELRALPGIQAAATSGFLPGITSDSRTEVKIMEGRAASPGKIFADSRFISSGYFAAMNIPLLEGEACRPSERQFNSVVVNRSFANTYLSGTQALGRHLEWVSSQFLPSPAVILGVAGDAREQGLNREPIPTVYWCVSASTPSPYFLVQAQGEPLALATTIRQKLHQIEPARSVYGISTLEEHLSDSFAETRLRTTLLALFALVAVSLAAIGLYGTLSYFVTVRKREVGLRLALGAMRRQIVSRFLFQGLAVSGIGCFAGLFLAAGFVRVLTGMLYGISAADPLTFISVPLLILSVAALASLLPALRAARVEVMQVLRDE